MHAGAFKGVRRIQPGGRLHREDGLFVQPHAAKRPGAQGASPPRLCPFAVLGLCRAPVPPYRVRVVLGGSGRIRRAAAAAGRARPRQPAGPPLVHAGAFERVRCIQFGGRLQRQERLVRPAGRLCRPRAPRAPRRTLCAQAGTAARCIPVPRCGPGPLPGALERRSGAKRRPRMPGVDIERPAVALGRPAVAAPPPLNVAHLDMRPCARRVGRRGRPVLLLNVGGPAANEAVPAGNALRGAPCPLPGALLFGPAAVPLPPAQVLGRLCVPHYGLGKPAAAPVPGRNRAAFVRACGPRPVHGPCPLKALDGLPHAAALSMAPPAACVRPGALRPGPLFIPHADQPLFKLAGLGAQPAPLPARPCVGRSGSGSLGHALPCAASGYRLCRHA